MAHLKAQSTMLTLWAMTALLSGCNRNEVNADFTGVDVRMRFEARLNIKALHLRGTWPDGTPAIDIPDIPVPDQEPQDGLEFSQWTAVLGDEQTGRQLGLDIEGRTADEQLVGFGQTAIRLRLGLFVTATVAVTADVLCGNGILDEGEACDDGGRINADGCSERCRIEDGYICIRAPSRCGLESGTALVDAAVGCPGNGTQDTPFCTIGRGLTAPWADAVFIKAGRYDETLTLREDHTLVAETGAVLESVNDPTLDIVDGQVDIEGLAVEGFRRIGGGLRIANRARARLTQVQIGPGSAVGITLLDTAFVELSKSRVELCTEGGLRLDSGGGFIVENTILTQNGNDNSDFGGVHIVQSPAGSRLVHNTLTQNQASDATRAAFVCDAPAPISSTIVWNNGTITSSVTAACPFRFSDLGPISGNVVLTNGNFSEDPKFEADFRLAPDSPCIDRGDPEAIDRQEAPTDDIDGEPRPQGPNVDVGADEAG